MTVFGHLAPLRSSRRSRGRRALAVIACAGLSLTVGREAHAVPDAEGQVGAGSAVSAEKLDLARTHFARGVQFYNNGDYKLSLVEFRRSYELSRNYRILYNIGQVNHQLNNYTKALAALEDFLREGAGDIPPERRAEVQASIEELRKKTSSVRVTVNVPDAEIVLDDVVLGPASQLSLVRVDSGDHRVEARRAGYVTARAEISLAAGEAGNVRLQLERVETAPPPSRPAPPAAPERSPSLVWVGWAATGALAVGASVTGVLAASYAKDLADLRNSPTSTAGERESASNNARTLAITSDVLTAAAVATGAVSLYFTLSDGSTHEGTPPRTALRVAPLGLSFVHRY